MAILNRILEQSPNATVSYDYDTVALQVTTLYVTCSVPITVTVTSSVSGKSFSQSFQPGTYTIAVPKNTPISYTAVDANGHLLGVSFDFVGA